MKRARVCVRSGAAAGPPVEASTTCTSHTNTLLPGTPHLRRLLQQRHHQVRLEHVAQARPELHLLPVLLLLVAPACRQQPAERHSQLAGCDALAAWCGHGRSGLLLLLLLLMGGSV